LAVLERTDFFAIRVRRESNAPACSQSTASVAWRMLLELRDYQQDAVAAVLAKWREFDRLLGISSTGTGKTITFAYIANQRVCVGPVLVLAHRDELLDQARDKIARAVGLVADKEKGEERAALSSRLVVGSVQTLSRRDRLFRFPQNHFATVIVDEAHRTLADSYQRILEHFSEAKVLGVTATPDRGDQRSLATYFEDIAFEISLTDMIRAGWLCAIKVKTVPLEIDISEVGMRAGDYSDEEIAIALEPILQELAGAVGEHAFDRRTLVFCPLVRTSYQFADVLRQHGLSAEAICGESQNRKEILGRFSSGQTRVLCNAMLLTEGYDEPSIDCVICLRPTTVRSLFAQMVGRGTRRAPGKNNLLVLDFLWLSREHNLVKPASLIAKDEAQAAEIEAQLSQADGDLLLAESNAQAQREAALQQRLDRQRQQDGDEVDLLELATRWQAPDIIGYSPTFRWERQPVSEKQIAILERAGVDLRLVQNRGHASVILSRMFAISEREPATQRQKNYCRYLGHPNPQNLTKREAARWIGAHK
jgi:superfamily II DNA or RNA helicase